MPPVCCLGYDPTLFTREFRLLHECAICLHVRRNSVRVLPCEHEFCEQCARTQGRCPLCRMEILDVEPALQSRRAIDSHALRCQACHKSVPPSAIDSGHDCSQAALYQYQRYVEMLFHRTLVLTFLLYRYSNEFKNYFVSRVVREGLRPAVRRIRPSVPVATAYYWVHNANRPASGMARRPGGGRHPQLPEPLQDEAVARIIDKLEELDTVTTDVVKEVLQDVARENNLRASFSKSAISHFLHKHALTYHVPVLRKPRANMTVKVSTMYALSCRMCGLNTCRQAMLQSMEEQVQDLWKESRNLLYFGHFDAGVGHESAEFPAARTDLLCLSSSRRKR